jgi:epoxyqueuosine reductase
MNYLSRHEDLRRDPAQLVPGALRVVTVRMDYLPRLDTNEADRAVADTARLDDDWRSVEWRRLRDPAAATVSIYARGRDYHKVLRLRLAKLAQRIEAELGPCVHRAFTDSAPVFEVEFAARSGLAWRGKHTLALTRDAGSTFFLGELFVGLPLPVTPPVSAHCGTCSACIDVCPTRAIVAPYKLDARRCIAYLTIEHEGAIPIEFRAAIGNRVFGCDDCQLVCPWNKHAQRAKLEDFDAREPWGQTRLLELWQWDEAEFSRRSEGTVLRRAGWQRWRRNLAVALGNAHRQGVQGVGHALTAARSGASEMVQEHIDWALSQPTSAHRQ